LPKVLPRQQTVLLCWQVQMALDVPFLNMKTLGILRIINMLGFSISCGRAMGPLLHQKMYGIFQNYGKKVHKPLRILITQAGEVAPELWVNIIFGANPFMAIIKEMIIGFIYGIYSFLQMPRLIF